MLRVTLEIIPFGSESAKETISTIEIVNVGTSPNRPAYGNYAFRIKNLSTGTIIENNVHNFDRSRGALALLKTVLDKIAEIIP